MDDGGIPQYIFIIILLLLGGAYFAGAETALASVSRIRMISGADDGNKRAKKVLYILDNFDKALTTLLIGNNIMHIACASTTTLMASKLWGNSAVTATTFVTTFVVFIVAEMIPKSYAKACNEQFALMVAGSLIVLMKILTPVSAVFAGISSMAQKLLGASAEEEPTVTEAELFDIIENIDDEDEIDEETTELVQSALEFTVTSVKDIVTPWEKVVTVKTDMTDDEIMGVIRDSHYSRMPVLDEEGAIVGILQIRKFLKSRIDSHYAVRSKAMLDRVQYVSASMPIDDLLPAMSYSRTHLAIVRDDDGSLMGIVTIEDILEELVGEIYDEEETGGETA